MVQLGSGMDTQDAWTNLIMGTARTLRSMFITVGQRWGFSEAMGGFPSVEGVGMSRCPTMFTIA